MSTAKSPRTVKGAARLAGHEVHQATKNPWIKALTRYGYFARGVVFATIGFLALALAAGKPGTLTDQNGALVTLAAQPFGRILLIAIVVGLSGFALWGFIRAIFDPLGRGNDKKGIIERIGFLTSGISYSALVAPFMQVILSGRRAASMSQSKTTQDIAGRILAMPFGPWLVGLIGLLVIGWGLGQVRVSYTASFKKDFEASKMNAVQEKWMIRLGRVGISTRGLVYTLMGFFFLQAALRADPKQAIGLDGALQVLANQPGAALLLVVAAIGLIVFGFYSVLCALWIEVD